MSHTGVQSHTQYTNGTHRTPYDTWNHMCVTRGQRPPGTVTQAALVIPRRTLSHVCTVTNTVPSGTDSHTHNTHSDTCDTEDEVPQEPAPGVSCCGHHVSTWARGSGSGESGGLTAQISPSFSVSLSFCPLKDIIGQTRTYVCHPCPPTHISWV